MSFDFFPNEQTATLINAARRPSSEPDPGAFHNFMPGAGQYAMRSLAEVGRAVDLAGAVFPVAIDAVTGGTERQDQYFREHDEVFNHAVDHWTPAPGEVGTAGQVVGQLAGGVLQAAISPALLVGTAHLSTAEDLVRQGVDAGAANVAGDIAGLGAAVGVSLPYLGKTLVPKVLSGAIGNVGQGAATAGATQAVLEAAGAPALAKQYDPWDLKARALDALLGAAFGGLAHLSEPARPARKLTPTEEAALLVANQARHLEQSTAPGRPVSQADLVQHVQAMREALGQVLAGEPVRVDKTLEAMRTMPDDGAARQRVEVADEMARLAKEEAPPVDPVLLPPDQSPARAVDGLPDAARPTLPPDDMTSTRARAALTRSPDMAIPTGAVDEMGNAVFVRAADALAGAEVDAAATRATAGELFRTAATCLLGIL